jgi:DNA-binding NtrC family response regulator
MDGPKLQIAIQDGVPAGESLASLTDEFQRQVIVATLKREKRCTRAARALGITREWLYKLRKKFGLPIEQADERPIPEDWRERLSKHPIGENYCIR